MLPLLGVFSFLKMWIFNVRVSGTRREGLLGVSKDYDMTIVTHARKAGHNISLIYTGHVLVQFRTFVYFPKKFKYMLIYHIWKGQIKLAIIVSSTKINLSGKIV